MMPAQFRSHGMRLCSALPTYGAVMRVLEYALPRRLEGQPQHSRRYYLPVAEVWSTLGGADIIRHEALTAQRVSRSSILRHTHSARAPQTAA